MHRPEEAQKALAVFQKLKDEEVERQQQRRETGNSTARPSAEEPRGPQ